MTKSPDNGAIPLEQWLTMPKGGKAKRCQAHKKNGQQCGNPAHGGKVCSSHGAGTRKRVLDGTRKPVAPPIKHGRYSSIKRPRIKALLEQFSSDPDPLSLEPELMLLRALSLDYIERYDAFSEALIGWHSSYGPGFQELMGVWRTKYATWLEEVESAGYETRDPPKPPSLEEMGKPRQIADILTVGNFVDKIGSMVERIEKQRSENKAQFIGIATLNRVLEQMGVELVDAVREVGIDEPQRSKLLNAVEGRWLSIRAEPDGTGSTKSAGKARSAKA